MSSILALAEPRSRVAEAYRLLATNLSVALGEAKPWTVVVSSPASELDKSAVVANLAVVLAQAGKTVVVIDGDLRRPRQHTLFGLGNENGLSGFLEGALPDASPPWQSTAVPGLRVLTSGPEPTLPAALLAGERFASFVASLADSAEAALIDAPPVLVAADAAVIAARVGRVLLVLEAGHSRRDHVLRVRETLEQVGAQIVGVVLTGIDGESIFDLDY